MSSPENVKCMKKKRSAIFNYFLVTDSKFAKCHICNHTISYKTSNTNLKKHIMRKHPTVLLPPASSCKVEQGNEDMQPSTSTGLPLSITQICHNGTTTSNPATNTSKRPQQRTTACIPQKLSVSGRRKINGELIKLFTVDMQPLSMVEDTGFRSFVKALNPSYTLPTKHTLSNTMLPALYEKCQNAVRKAIKGTQLVCLTTDCWTSTSNESFMAVTAHFVSTDFEIKSILLECCPFPNGPTSLNLAVELKRIVTEWDLQDKILLVVSNNAPNIEEAITHELEWNFFGCLGHKINLIVQGSLDTVTNLLSNIRRIVAHFKTSSSTTNNFLSYQRDSGLQPKELVLDVVTQWSSTYCMLERFCELEEAVKTTFPVSNQELPVLSPAEWEMAKELCQVLKPFFLTTKSLGGEKYAPASLAIVLSNGLLDVCSNLMKKEFSENVSAVVLSLYNGVEEKLGSVDQNDTLYVTMFLDPRFKTCFNSHQLAEDIKNKVVILVASKLEIEPQEEVRNPEKGKENAVEDDDLSPWASVDRYLAAPPENDPFAKAQVEVRRYLEEPPLGREKNPLEWWKQNCYNFPHLSKIVLEYFCCLATSVPCDRLFSKGGYILNDRRTRLSSTKVREIMFINTNIEFIK